MAISTFDLFKIGIGPSSSHTIGPMRAAKMFAESLATKNLLDSRLKDIRIELFGSLGHTGRGHGTDKALMLGLIGERPEQVDVDKIEATIGDIFSAGKILLNASFAVSFNKKSMIFNKRKTLPAHSNGMCFSALDAQNQEIFSRTYYSIGGGFIIRAGASEPVKDETQLKYPYSSGDELLNLCHRHKISIPAIMRENERSWRDDEQTDRQLDKIWAAMQSCVQRGCRQSGVLPGGLKLARRAPKLYKKLNDHPEKQLTDHLIILDWVNLYALAVNEENAAGGRVVTAPTNGAAGIVPAVLHYYDVFCPGANMNGIRDFLLTAAAIGIIYMENASISGAEVGCQGEVGVACSMAAGGLVAALGGSPRQVENAAEIGMEHNLGLTCDPIGGLVQIPCIERNAMGAVKAINAQRIAMRGDGAHHVSLDKVIKTMRETGADMKTKYKETSRGGLAVNVVEC